MLFAAQFVYSEKDSAQVKVNGVESVGLNTESESSEGIDLNEESEQSIQDEIDQTLREAGLSNDDIDQIKESVKRTSAGDEKNRYKVAHEAIEMTNELIEDVNNIYRLKTGAAEAELLGDVLSLEMGQDGSQELSEEEKQHRKAQEEEDAKPLTTEQKQLLEDLEAELNDIDEDDFDLIDL